MENLFHQRTDLEHVHKAVTEIKQQISKIVVGQETMIDLLIAAILADGHVLIEGVPGIAKTLTAKLFAKTLSVSYSRIQFTPDLMPSDVLGTTIFDPHKATFSFKKGPIFSNVVLIDEINRAPAKTQSALFEVMEEKQVTMDGKTYTMDAPFLVLATQNPLEQEGTYRLPEAQLDRFLFKIEITYPTVEEEFHIISGFHTRGSKNDLEQIDAVLSADQLRNVRTIIHNIHIEEALIRYIAQIVSATRNNPNVYLGASPRASLAIMKGAKAKAAMKGRDFVSPEDIQEVAGPVLVHRILLSAEKEMEGTTPQHVIEQIVKSIQIPR